jgi:hypothetical protein
VLKRLLDPRELDVRAEPKEVRDLMIASQNNWVLAFDNLSHLPAWLSDAFCRLATGGGFGTRGLYTDDEEQTFTAKRPVVLNGIEDFVTRGDLLERSLVVRHPTISEDRRRPEEELWAEFDELAPGLLGAVFDYVAGGLSAMPTVRLARLPRMADFARFAVACEVARVGNGDEILRSYRENLAGADEQVLEDSPVAAVVQKFMAGKDEWRGKASDVLKQLKGQVAEDVQKEKEWPKRPNALSNKLKRLAPSLRKATGIDVQVGVRETDRGRTRLTVLRRLPDHPPDGSSAPSADGNVPGPAADDPPDDQRSADRPPTVQRPSDTGTPVQPPATAADDPAGADDPSGESSGQPPDPPVNPQGQRRRGRV